VETSRGLVRPDFTRPAVGRATGRGRGASFSSARCVRIYDLGIERMEATDIEIAAQADLAARALFSDRHGEMFLAIGYRELCENTASLINDSRAAAIEAQPSPISSPRM
jgi:hypothetical protein